VTSMVIDSIGTIYAGTSSGVIRSTDHGESWDSLYAGMAYPYDRYVLSFTQDFQGGVFAGTSYGIYRLDTTSNSWITINDAIPYGEENVVAGTPGGHLLVATSA
jgi:ligand-binding sensor domain-containing protein